MSTTPDNTFADPEQLIADLRRLLAEREAEQAATAEVLQIINSSPGLQGRLVSLARIQIHDQSVVERPDETAEL
jgi:hypothetical protein